MSDIKTREPEPLPCPCGRLAEYSKIKPRHWMVTCGDLGGCRFGLAAFGQSKNEAIENWDEEVRKHDRAGKRH